MKRGTDLLPGRRLLPTPWSTEVVSEHLPASTTLRDSSALAGMGLALSEIRRRRTGRLRSRRPAPAAILRARARADGGVVGDPALDHSKAAAHAASKPDGLAARLMALRDPGRPAASRSRWRARALGHIVSDHDSAKARGLAMSAGTSGERAAHGRACAERPRQHGDPAAAVRQIRPCLPGRRPELTGSAVRGPLCSRGRPPSPRRALSERH